MFTLETERLWLRPLRIEDAPTLHQLLDTVPEVYQFDPGYARSFAERVQCIERRLEQYQQYGFGCFAIELKPTAVLIGQGGLSPWQLEDVDGTVTEAFEVMYALGKPYWNQGYATEMARAWVDYAFHTAGLRRLVVGPARANIASVRVLEKVGFRIEDDPLDPEGVLAVLDNPRIPSSSR